MLGLSPCAQHHSVHFIHAPIFRLLLKVAVNGTHQCDFLNFCGGFGSQLIIETHDASAPGVVGPYGEDGIQHASQLACMYMLEEARKLTSS